MLGFLLSKAGLSLIALALVAGAFGVEEVQKRAAQHGQKHAEADLAQAQEALKTCAGRLTAQNAAVASQAALSARAMDTAAKAQASVAPRAAHYAGQAKAASAVKLSGTSQCERWDDADRHFLELLK